jgi:beta-xylosidase
MSGGDLHPLAPDGLSITGTPIYIYKGWPIPEEWDIESFSLEGINLKKIGDYYYLLAAEGGTAGPPTGHMVVQARSRSVEGPFENAPNNPLLRTQSPDEQWWSQGHGQVIEGLHGELFMTFHAYEKGFLTLGRQNLICQLEMGKDGWLQLKKGKIDLPQPIRKTEKGISDFVWQSYKEGITDRAVITSDSIVLKAEGKTPLDSSPLLLRAGDHSYEVVARLELSDPNTLGGLILFYDNQRNFGFGFGREMPLRFRNGAVSRTRSLFDIKPDASGKTVVWVKIRNTNHIISGWYSPDGKAWHKYPWGYDMSGFHHNTLGEFLSVRPGIFAAGDGAVTATQLRYIKVN